jgi:hypothetical protein
LLVDVDVLTALDRDGAICARLARLAANSVALGLLSTRSLGELNGTLEALRRGPGPVLLATESGAFLYDITAGGVQLKRSNDAPAHPLAIRPTEAPYGRRWKVLLDELATRGITAGATAVLDLGAEPAYPREEPTRPPEEFGDTTSARRGARGRSTESRQRRASLSAAARTLDEQLAQRAGKRVPRIHIDPAWVVLDTGTGRSRPGAQAAIFTIGDGTIATRGVALDDPGSAAVLAQGVYIGAGSRQHLRPGPGWTALGLTGPVIRSRRTLDLRAGLLFCEDLGGEHPLRTIRFASAVRPGVQVLRAESSKERLSAGPPLQPPAEGIVERGRDEGVTWTRTIGDIGSITAVAVQDVVEEGPTRAIERLAVYRTASDVEDAVIALSEAAQVGFDGLLAEHRQTWARRWENADVEIPDDPAAQQAFRFALFQLWSNVGCPIGPDGAWSGTERAVGARGLSGPGYAGHVFWDADVFVLPAMATICPAAARAMLEYRIRRLPVARARAAAERRAGARFPWESARDGEEVTPTSGLVGKEIMQIRTGQMEEHIVADVAWAAERYASWTGDVTARTGPARALVVETARYWASRITRTPDGRGHINDVIGPDEYHEGVDDNAFTNIMARWNLRRGADLVPDEHEASVWRALADSLVDGFDPITHQHEQFAGYHDLEPLLVTGIAPLPFAADLVLGRGRTWRSQIIKQADVLMAHFLVPHELPKGSLEADLDFYVPRTSHGSSLSPAITAALLARAGRPDAGLETLQLALRLDLDDLTGSSAGGLHLATIGGTWQALVDGFLGLEVSDGILQADPQLPSAWKSLQIRLQVLGAHITLEISDTELVLTTDHPLRFRPTGSPVVNVARRARFERAGKSRRSAGSRRPTSPSGGGTGIGWRPVR